MDSLRQTMRAQATQFYRWLIGQCAARQQQGQEQTTPNGVVRQTLDPDQAILQQHRAGPWRAGDEGTNTQRPVPTQQAPSLSTQAHTMQQRLREQQDAEAQRQAAAQRRGQDYGR
jgi:hypothetical protein